LLTTASVNTIEFSGDLQYVAVGTKQSYIRVWKLDGSAMPAKIDFAKVDDQPEGSHRLIGHSAAVYSLSFSPSTAKPSADSPATASQYLLSASLDKTIRLWSLETWKPLIVYRGHNAPVWDVRWGPYGHYFLSAGLDNVARLWITSKAAAVRWFVGHDGDVDCICFHPNGAYVFTGGDKSVRMWDVNRGNAVRMFTGHIGAITTLECSPDGKTLASADDQGQILLWDLPSGTLMKRMRGHGKGGIWSLSWSMESTVIASGCADQTVRIWDATQRQTEKGADGVTKLEGIGSSSTAATGTKKSKKDVIVSPDQISAFPTKKSPVYKVHFNRQNLVLAASCYMPEPA
jgi:transcription initiation factor TFIID subunit 5